MTCRLSQSKIQAYNMITHYFSYSIKAQSFTKEDCIIYYDLFFKRNSCSFHKCLLLFPVYYVLFRSKN